MLEYARLCSLLLIAAARSESLPCSTTPAPPSPSTRARSDQDNNLCFAGEQALEKATKENEEATKAVDDCKGFYTTYGQPLQPAPFCSD